MRPDILIVLVDCLRFDTLNAEVMPYLCRLAGMRSSLPLSNCYSSSPWTLPSFASLLTGLFPGSHGLWMNIPFKGSPLLCQRPDVGRLLSEDLREAGYHTFSFQTNPFGGGTAGLDRGFDFFDECGETRHHSGKAAGQWHFFRSLSPVHKLKFAVKFAGVKALNLFERTKVEESLGTELFRHNGRIRGEYLTHRFGRYVQSQMPDRPAFGVLHFMDLHTPYVPPLRSHFYTSARHLCPRRSAHTYTVGDRRAVLDRYRACARYLDGLLKATIEHYKAVRRRPALLFVTSDHGEEFWDHGDSSDEDSFYDAGTGHGHTLYGELVHVPLVVHAVGMPCPLSDRRLCSLVDLRPTLLSVLGIEPQGPMDGADLTATDNRDCVLSEFLYSGPERKAVITEDLKMIARRAGNEAEIYDLRADPLEKENIASQQRPNVERIRRVWNEKFAGASFEPVQSGADEETLERLKSLGYC